ncbi:MAG: sigma-70 family RNA polymerase sigma factor [Planctomycetes bacterium]|nr:sigma-70 family RNA polymerase sigma factor [Planctomycetota bacterium]
MPRPSPDHFERLVRDHHAAVYRSARRIAGADDAADVAQEVFTRVLCGKVDLDRARSDRATLCWLATRLAANSERARRRRARHEETAMKAERNTSPDPAQHAIHADLLNHMVELLSALPSGLRLPVQLHCQDEMSFAAIGATLDISESTAHERYRRGIDTLRDRLRGRGLALGALPLADLVAGLPAPAVPAALESRLLALGKSSALATAGIARRLATFALVATAAVAVSVAVGSRGVDGPSPTTDIAASAVMVDGRDGQDPPAPPPGVRVPAPSPAGTADARADSAAKVVAADSVFHGTVHDSGGWAVAGAPIVAISSGGLKEFEIGRTTTGDDGAFRLQIRPGILDGLVEVVKLRVLEDHTELLATGDYELPRAADAEPLRLVLPATSGTVATQFELAVAVRAADGSPLADLRVELYSAGSGRPRPGWGAEIEASTDAFGIARLTGRRPGAKFLFVDGRAHGYTASFTAMTIERPGASDATIRLQAGRSLTGTVTSVDGSRTGELSLWLQDSDGLGFHADLGNDGIFRFSGLSDREYTLGAGGQPWSPMQREGLRPSERPLSIRLKRFDDPRDVGDHMAEVHGTVIDAETGEVVAFDGFAIEIHRSGNGESSLATDLCPPPAPVQRGIDGRMHEAFDETGLAAGRHVLVARIPGYATTARAITLAKGQIVADLRIAMQRGADLRGTVTDERGMPVAGATVFVIGVGTAADDNLRTFDENARARVEDVGWPSLMPCATRSAADGSFVLGEVPPGVMLRVTAFAKDRCLAVQPARVFGAGESVEQLAVRLPAR